MKRKVISILLVVFIIISCQKQGKTIAESIITSRETLSTENQVNVQSNIGITEEVYDINPSSEYTGLDFSTLPVTKRMLDRWNSAEPEMMDDYQYRNSGLTRDEIDTIANAYISIYGLSVEEQKIVGYWFALDGADKTNEDMSFMDALRRSQYPRLAIYPNGYFVCAWSNNGPFGLIDKVDSQPINSIRSFFVRGIWEIKENKILLIYRQFYLNTISNGRKYYNLSIPYELELIDLDAISDDNITTERFAAFTQPAEILEQIPDSLIFINKPEYFIRSYYTYSVNIDNGKMERWSPLFSAADILQLAREKRGITIDDILTSTEGLLQEKYWH